MKRPWVIYGIYVDGRLRYIGQTADPRMRYSNHVAVGRWGGGFTTRTLRRAATEVEALRLERALIEKRQPPDNIQRNESARGTAQLVKTTRPGADETRLPITMRLRAGVLHPDLAGPIWHDPSYSHGREALAHMPGWTWQRAIFMFGPQSTCRKA